MFVLSFLSELSFELMPLPRFLEHGASPLHHQLRSQDTSTFKLCLAPGQAGPGSDIAVPKLVYWKSGTYKILYCSLVAYNLIGRNLLERWGLVINPMCSFERTQDCTS